MNNSPAIILIALVLSVPLFLYLGCDTIKESSNSSQNSEEESKLTVATNKLVYEYGEPVEITVSLGDFPAANETYLELGQCNCDIERDDYKSIFDYTDRFVTPTSDKCKKCSEPYNFELKKFQTKTLIWGQQSCELKNYPSPAVPGDYEVSVECSVADWRGSSWEGVVYGGIGDWAEFKINAPLSCRDKQVEVVEARWDSSKNIHLKIKNTGALDVEAVQVLLDECDMDFFGYRAHFGPTNISILGGIKVGEIKEYTISPKQSECYYRAVSISVYECSDGNSDNWSEIVQPQ
jgi:hypothetical protein